MQTISGRIFELLRARNMSQKEFAQKTGIAESSISDWKKKRTNPGSDKILIICEVLGVTPYELLSGDDEESCKTQAEAILKFANPKGYPKVKDSGEPSHVSGKKTRDLFEDWMNENF